MTFAERRTIRRYTTQPVGEAELKEMLTLAARASNTGNMQTYSVVITREEEKKRALAPAHFQQPMVTTAPVVLTFCADYNRFRHWCIARKAEPGYDNFQSFVGAAIDAVIFAQTFAVIAEERGLGICYLGTTTYNAAAIIETLELPKRVVPVCTLTLGWPDGMPEQPERLPIEAVIHEETYKDYTREDIDRLYAEKEGLESSVRFVQENGKETLAQVFTDVRYKKADCEHFSEEFLKVLRTQCFL